MVTIAAAPIREITELDADMTTGDLIAALERLPLPRHHSHCTISIDRGVVTFLVRLLREKRNSTN